MADAADPLDLEDDAPDGDASGAADPQGAVEAAAPAAPAAAAAAAAAGACAAPPAAAGGAAQPRAILDQEVKRLQGEQKALRQAARETRKKLKAAQRKRRRLLARAKELSTADLRVLLQARGEEASPEAEPAQ